MPRTLTLAALLGATLMAPVAGQAQGISVAQATTMLSSQDADEVRMGIETMGLSGSPRAVQPLAARIRSGLPAELLDVALDTLLVLGRPEAGPVLFELATHRRAEVRLKAVSAIASAKPRGAERVLQVSLSDSDPEVRGAAAVGLGEIAARDSLPRLFLAFEKGVLEAGTAIGQLAGPEEVGRLLRFLGQVPFDSLTPALNEVMARTDISQRSKLDVIGAMQELATGEAKVWLQDLVASLPEGRAGGAEALRRTAEDAILRIAD